MKVRYVKADPSGNTTILVLDPVEPRLRSVLAVKLLQPDCVGAEQVAYLAEEAERTIRVDMMGGEFCGNASRSAAAYALMAKGGKEGEYGISCSGCCTMLPAQVKKRPDGTYDAYIEMPLPESVCAVIIDVGGMPRRFFRVELPGIVHFVHFASENDMNHKETFWQAVRNYASDEPLRAIGLVLFNPVNLQMIPAVFVAATDTLYWEQSCGSGSAAVAAALACVGKKNVSCTIRQPGGTIAIAADVAGEDKELQRIYIGGPVTFEEVKEIEVDL